MKKKVETSETLREGNRGSSRNAREQSIQRLYFTSAIFDYDLETVRQALEPIAKKLIIGKEICPSNGKPHLQTFIACKRKMRFKQLTDRFPNGGVKFQPCFSSEEANTRYCSKDGDVYRYEWVPPKPNPREHIRKHIPDLQTMTRTLCEMGKKPNSVHHMYPELIEVLVDAYIKCEVNPYDFLMDFLVDELENNDATRKLIGSWNRKDN